MVLTENAKHHKVAIYKNMVDLPENVYRTLSDGARNVSSSKKAEISQNVYSQLNAAVDKDGKFNADLVPDGPHKQVIVCLLYTSPSPRDRTRSRMPSSA